MPTGQSTEKRLLALENAKLAGLFLSKYVEQWLLDEMKLVDEKTSGPLHGLETKSVDTQGR